jgi:sugar lactone lactonase YvrE
MSAAVREHGSLALSLLLVTLLAVAAGCAGSGARGSVVMPAVPSQSAHRALAFLTGAGLPSKLLFVPTGSDKIDIYALKNPNARGPLAEITRGLVGTQFQMTTDSAGDLFVVNDNFLNSNQEYVSVYVPPYTGRPTILSGVTFPIGVAVDADGTVYVSDCGVYCDQKPAVYIYRKGSTRPTGTIVSSSFSSLGGLALDRSGDLYVASCHRATGASDVFEVPAGSSDPRALGLDGLFNLGGPGIGSVTLDEHGDLYVGNNSNSTYILEFESGSTEGERIIDPFSFFDVVGIDAYGSDGNLYVPIDCGNQSCEGAVLGFKPRGRTPFETVGAPAQLAGVATVPNPIFDRQTRTPDVYLRPSATPMQRGATIAARVSPWSRVAEPDSNVPMLHPSQQQLPAAHSGGRIAPALKRNGRLIYISDNGSGGRNVGAVDIYPAQGQTQPRIGRIVNGISAPAGIATDTSGALYVANSGNNTVTVYPPGQTAPSVTYRRGISDPYSVAIAKDGTVYVANAISTPSNAGDITEYKPRSTAPNLTITNPGESPVSVALDARNNLYVGWYSLSTESVEVDEYVPGSTTGTNLKLDLPAPSFPVYSIAFDHAGNLVLWYEDANHATKYLATFAPGSTKPSRTIPGGSFLDVVSGIAFPRSSKRVYVAAINVNEGDELAYPSGLPLDVIGLNHAWGVSLSPDT